MSDPIQAAKERLADLTRRFKRGEVIAATPYAAQTASLFEELSEHISRLEGENKRLNAVITKAMLNEAEARRQIAEARAYIARDGGLGPHGVSTLRDLLSGSATKTEEEGGLPELPSGSLPEAAVGATAALAKDAEVADGGA